MRAHADNRDPEGGGRPTRREVLRVAAAAGLSAIVPSGIAPGASRVLASAPGEGADLPWWMNPPHVRSRVVDIRSASVFRGSALEQSEVAQVLSRGVRALTAAQTDAEAWRTILGDAQRIVLKFNAVGAKVIGTTPAMARALVSALSDAGYDRAHITLVEVPRHLAHELETAQPADGWGAPIAVGGRQEPLAAYLYGADAIINVPFLKTHLLAGMSGCLKNLSHALIRHPGLFHDGGCAPYVGQVVGNKEVSDRLRLNVVTAFRIVTRNGPDATEDDLYAHGGLLLGFDPLAVDTLGLSVLTLRRAQLGLPGALRVPYLESAARLGVGRMERRELEHVLLKDGA